MKTTIIYENSCGFLAQWTGEVLRKTETSIDIKFSANSALRFDLKLNSGFMVVTKTKIKDLGLNNQEILVSCDDDLRSRVLSATKNNVSLYWNGNRFENI